jgi:molybdopterin-guanine dinucleotide biosynthesis protein
VHAATREKPALSAFLEGEFGLRACDVVVVEGFRGEAAFPKIEVCRTATGRAPLCEADPSVVAIVTDFATKHPSSIPRFTFEQVPSSLYSFLRKSPVFSSL